MGASDEKIWGWKGIAARLGVSVNTAAKYAREKGLPAKTWGDGPRPRYFALEEELEAWEEANARLLSRNSEESETAAERSAAAGTVGKPAPGLHSAASDTATTVSVKGFGLRTGLLAVSLAIVVLAVAVSVWRATRQEPLETPDERPPNSLHLAPAPGGMMALDRLTGEPLWPEPLRGATESNAIEARIRGLGVVLAVVYQAPDYDLREGKTLQLLDPLTRETLDTITLDKVERCLEVFPDYSPFYRTRLSAVDLDGDGSDEVVIVYAHAPNLPSCSLLYEPGLRRVRAVYASLGHQRFQGAADLDGDGKHELIFGAVSNKVSWYRGVAAVRLIPSVGSPGPTVPPVHSPEIDARGSGEDLLLWVAYAEPGSCVGDDRCLRIDAAKGVLEFRGKDTLFLDRHGFEPRGLWFANFDRRQDARQRAYEAIRDARRLCWLRDAGNPLEALEPALRYSEIARDPVLRRIVLVTRVQSLIALGETERAVDEAERLGREHKKFGAYMAFEIALAFHLHGYVDEAVAWYVRGFGAGAPEGGLERPRGEFLRNMVMAFVGRGDFDAARRAIASYGPYVAGNWVDNLQNYVALSSGVGTDFPARHPDMSDEQSYWVLEGRYRVEGPSPPLITELEDALRRNSEAKPLVGLLLAEAQLASGNTAEVLQLLLEAEQELPHFKLKYIVANVYEEQAKERLGRLRAALAGELQRR